MEKGSLVDSYLELKGIIDSPSTYEDYEDERKNDIAGSIKDDFDSLVRAIRDYVKSANDQEDYMRLHGSEVTEEAKDKQVLLDADRKSTHNMLIQQLNVVAFELKSLGIDNKLIRAIIGSGNKIDTHNEAERRSVEKWAREVGDYLATVSETTL